MIPTSRDTNRLIGFFLVLFLMGVILWSGTRLINNTMDSEFYRQYLLPAQATFGAVSASQDLWPVFTGGNHVAYMNKLGAFMQQRGISLPVSNRNVYYRYTLDKIGEKKQTIFLLVLPEKMIIYGLNQTTFMSIQKIMTESDNPHQWFGEKSTNGSYTGVWYL